MPAVLLIRMKHMGIIASLVLLTAFTSSLYAQEVTPDRPSVSDSAFTVAPGTFQLENGLSYSKGAERRSAVELLGRIGLTPNLELRLGGEPVVRLKNGVDETGFGDIELGAKYRVLDEQGAAPAVAFLPFVKLPTADRPIGSEKTDFGLALILSKPLPADFTADFNIGVAALGQGNSDYRGQGYTSLSIGRTFNSRLTAYGEVFYRTKAERGGPQTLGADVGIIYLVTQRVALDFAVERGLNSRADDYAFRAGVTILLGDAR
jgi:Putative MetA-pathway of phenol degradation